MGTLNAGEDKIMDRFFWTGEDYFVLEKKEMQWICWPSWRLNNYYQKYYMTIDVQCENKNKSLANWSCDAEIEFKVMNVLKENKNKKMCHFTKNSKIFNFGSFHYLGYVSNMRKSNVKIVATIDIKSLVEGEVEFSIPKNIGSEVALRLRDQTLYADRYALLSFSPIFRKILSDETNVDEIDISDDVDYKHAVEFLRFLYGRQPYISDRNFGGIVMLAKKYDVQCLLADIEYRIFNTGFFTVHEKLDFAKLYNFSWLQSEMREYLRKLRNRSAF